MLTNAAESAVCNSAFESRTSKLTLSQKVHLEPETKHIIAVAQVCTLISFDLLPHYSSQFEYKPKFTDELSLAVGDQVEILIVCMFVL